MFKRCAWCIRYHHTISLWLGITKPRERPIVSSKALWVHCCVNKWISEIHGYGFVSFAQLDHDEMSPKCLRVSKAKNVYNTEESWFLWNIWFCHQRSLELPRDTVNRHTLSYLFERYMNFVRSHNAHDSSEHNLLSKLGVLELFKNSRILLTTSWP